MMRLLSYCNSSEVNSLHSSQGSSDLRPWAASQGKSLAIYYSLTDAITDGDTVEDLSGNKNKGILNADYRVDFDSETREPKKTKRKNKTRIGRDDEGKAY